MPAPQGRAHIFCDYRIVDDAGQELPHDGQAVGHLQVRRRASSPSRPAAPWRLWPISRLPGLLAAALLMEAAGPGAREWRPLVPQPATQLHSQGSCAASSHPPLLPPTPNPPAQVRGPIVVAQYYRMAQQPAADPATRWFPTGDVASIDARGIMRITDRCARLGRGSVHASHLA